MTREVTARARVRFSGEAIRDVTRCSSAPHGRQVLYSTAIETCRAGFPSLSHACHAKALYTSSTSNPASLAARHCR